jgi:hypothetical protein
VADSDKTSKGPGRGANLKGIAKTRKPRLKAAERIRDVNDLTKPGYHNDGNGLYLTVTARGAKAWVFRFKWDGKLKEMGLGPYPSVSLDDARTQRDVWRKVYQVEGRNPIDVRREREANAEAAIEAAQRQKDEEEARRISATFGACANTYVDGQEVGWRNAKHRQQWRNTLTTYCTSIWDKDVANITNIDVQAVLAPIWTTKHETASRLRGRIERVLAYAKVNKLRDGENPARWKENLDHMLPPWKKRLVRGHHKAKPHEKVRDLVSELRQIDAIGALALEFTVLAAKRSSEVSRMRWAEIDLINKVWIIPEVRIKTYKEHREPLTERQFEILQIMQKMRTTGTVHGEVGHGLFSVLPDGSIVSDCGTSYAAPQVAKTAAILENAIEGDVSRETLIALLVHSASLPEPLQNKVLEPIARHMVGFGMPSASEKILEAGDNAITLVFAARIKGGQELNFEFAWPKCLTGPEGQCRGHAKLTLVFSPPLDSNYGSEFVRVNLNAALQQQQADGKWKGKLDAIYLPKQRKGPAIEAELIEHDLKWSTVKVFAKSFPRGVGKSSTWRLSMDYLERAGVTMPKDGVPFTAILTISDPDEAAPVFTDMRQSLQAMGAKLADIRTAARIATRT